MSEDKLKNVVEVLDQIEKDFSVPKNIRLRIKNAAVALEENGKSIDVRIDRSLQELDEVSDDPNIPSYTRTQIWNIVSLLESI